MASAAFSFDWVENSNNFVRPTKSEYTNFIPVAQRYCSFFAVMNVFAGFYDEILLMLDYQDQFSVSNF